MLNKNELLDLIQKQADILKNPLADKEFDISKILQEDLSNCNDPVGFFSMFSDVVADYFSVENQTKGTGLRNLMQAIVHTFAYANLFEKIMQLYIENEYISKLSLPQVIKIHNNFSKVSFIADSFTRDSSLYKKFFTILRNKEAEKEEKLNPIQILEVVKPIQNNNSEDTKPEVQNNNWEVVKIYLNQLNNSKHLTQDEKYRIYHNIGISLLNEWKNQSNFKDIDAAQTLLSLLLEIQDKYSEHTDFNDLLKEAENLLRRAYQQSNLLAKTAFICPEEVKNHVTNPNSYAGYLHPEDAKRIDAVRSAFNSFNSYIEELKYESIKNPRTELHPAIQAVHDEKYCDKLKQTAKKLPIKNKARYFDLKTEKTGDTLVSHNSLIAVNATISSLIAMYNKLFESNLDNGFIAGRPPGHHACHDVQQGFCLVNNVFTLAYHAIQQNKKVLIVDIDAHHGNGTLNMIEKHNLGSDKIYLIDLFYKNGFTIPQKKSYPSNIQLVKLEKNTKGPAYLNLLRNAFNQLNKSGFSQDIIIVSAGFDAALADNEIGNLSLLSKDYRKITHEIMTLARQKNSKLIFSLEGGYNLISLTESVRATIHTLANGYQSAQEAIEKISRQLNIKKHSNEKQSEILITEPNNEKNIDQFVNNPSTIPNFTLLPSNGDEHFYYSTIPLINHHGLLAKKDIPAGTTIPYEGEKISSKSFTRNSNQYREYKIIPDPEEYALNISSADEDYILDARYKGSIARFANTTNNGIYNAEFIPNTNQILITQPICAGEQMLLDYGPFYLKTKGAENFLSLIPSDASQTTQDFYEANKNLFEKVDDITDDERALFGFALNSNVYKPKKVHGNFIGLFLIELTDNNKVIQDTNQQRVSILSWLLYQGNADKISENQYDQMRNIRSRNNKLPIHYVLANKSNHANKQQMIIDWIGNENINSNSSLTKHITEENLYWQDPISGKTLFHLAIDNDQEIILKHLLERILTWSSNKKKYKNNEPCSKNTHDLFLLQDKNGFNALLYAISQDEIAMVFVILLTLEKYFNRHRLSLENLFESMRNVKTKTNAAFATLSELFVEPIRILLADKKMGIWNALSDAIKAYQAKYKPLPDHLTYAQQLVDELEYAFVNEHPLTAVSLNTFPKKEMENLVGFFAKKPKKRSVSEENASHPKKIFIGKKNGNVEIASLSKKY